MPERIPVYVHASQFPDQVQQELRRSLRTRRVNHKFHYDSAQQTQQWLALHQTYSPTRTDSNCQGIYEALFSAVVKRLRSPRVLLAGLGCGGGEKEARFIQRLEGAGHRVTCTLWDVSWAMVLVACQTVWRQFPATQCHAWVGDLLGVDDWETVLRQPGMIRVPRLITFFGMLPNFEPRSVLPRLVRALRPRDWLLCSANLVPGPDLDAGIQRILPQYDNRLTRQWLLNFLLRLGVKRRDGQVRFSVETKHKDGSCQRITAYFYFQRPCSIQLGRERFDFLAGDQIQLFFSYRYTPDQVCRMLRRYGLAVIDSWAAPSGEEGVFLCRTS